MEQKDISTIESISINCPNCTKEEPVPVGDNESSMEACCTGKLKHRDEECKKALVNRLSRIEGQVRGIKKMVEGDIYCVDILTQVAAVTSALNSFNKELLASHIKVCVADNIRNGNDEVVDELVMTIQKLMR